MRLKCFFCKWNYWVARLIVSLTLIVICIPALAQVSESPVDSINQRLDSLIVPPAKVDSVKSLADGGLDSLQSLNNSASQALKITNPDFTKYVSKLDSIKARLMHRRDSLKGKGLPTEHYTRSLDSLEQIDPLASWREQQSKLEKAQSGAQNTIQKPASVVNEKLGQLSSESGGRGNLPGGVNSPDLPSSNTDLNTPDLQLSELGTPNISELGPDISLDADALKKNIDIDQLDNVQDGLGEVSDLTGKAQSYSSDVDNISTGDLSEVAMPADLQSNLPTDGLGQMQEGDATIADATQQLAAFKNPEAFRAQTLERGKAEVVKQLAVRNPNLEGAVNKVSQYQKRGVSIFKKAKGLPAKKTKKEKLPVIERFVPGITFQVQKTNYLLIDINYSLRYRINTIFSIGAGWLDRIAFDDGSYTADGRAYGIRTFTEVSLIKGFSLRLDGERINSYVPLTVLQQDQGSVQWRNYYLGGLKKEFKFLTGVRGNIQFMYNLTHKDGTSPYANRFNVRFGFEFPLHN